MDVTMPSPFPGMDPYLEKPAFWASFHSRMIVALADAIAPSILPRYYIEVEAREDEESLLKERYLEVRSDQSITVIELRSQYNKLTATGQIAYEERRQEILSSTAHLVEIDLLRGNLPMPIVGEDGAIDWDYRILVSRSQTRPMADLYGFMLHEAIPSVPLPLGAGEAEPMVDLQAIFAGVYDRAGYEYRIDYQDMEEKKL
jgi:hypothetical protein